MQSICGFCLMVSLFEGCDISGCGYQFLRCILLKVAISRVSTYVAESRYLQFREFEPSNGFICYFCFKIFSSRISMVLIISLL